MSAINFTLTLFVEKPIEDVFKIVMNVRTWWSGLYSEEFTGVSEKIGDEFTFRAGDGAHYSKQKLVELVENEKLVWQVTESKLSFLKDTGEWTGSHITFEFSKKGNQTQVTFTHQGLTPEIECYDSCAPAWTMYIQQKLQPLLSVEKIKTKR